MKETSSPSFLTALTKEHVFSRRQMLGFLAVTGIATLVGCPEGTMLQEGSNTEQTADGGTTDSTATETTPTGEWATGGTASMTAKASYPNPFTSALTACALVATTTEGPCTTSTDLVRTDISDGWKGLPVRLSIKVVDTSCNPLSGATVRIWHTNYEGSYSGQTPNNNMCLKTQSYSANDFFRGVQTTDAEGVVSFDTCFPGWYRGRAVHIHFQIKQGNTSTRVSQLFFPEDITQEIFSKHSEYSSYGQPDTNFSNDNIMAGIPTSERDRHIMTVARMSDGAMLASKVVTVA
ncbi:MAG: protocatechuate 3,4-dioxygenase [Myxococcales bacterium]|nr:protocatechuate 3,4-dioxygenase [Myxococcales bacterium]